MVNKLADECMDRLSLLTLLVLISGGLKFWWQTKEVWMDGQAIGLLFVENAGRLLFRHVPCFYVVLILYLCSRLIETSGEIRHCYIYV